MFYKIQRWWNLQKLYFLVFKIEYIHYSVFGAKYSTDVLKNIAKDKRELIQNMLIEKDKYLKT